MALGTVALAGAASVGSFTAAAPASAQSLGAAQPKPATVQSCYGDAVDYTSYPGGNSSTNSYWLCAPRR